MVRSGKVLMVLWVVATVPSDLVAALIELYSRTMSLATDCLLLSARSLKEKRCYPHACCIELLHQHAPWSVRCVHA